AGPADILPVGPAPAADAHAMQQGRALRLHARPGAGRSARSSCSYPRGVSFQINMPVDTSGESEVGPCLPKGHQVAVLRSFQMSQAVEEAEGDLAGTITDTGDRA